MPRRALRVAQLKKALRQLVVSEINTRKTMSGQASRLGTAEVVVGDLDHSRAYFERLSTITSADSSGRLSAYLVPARLTSISLNPTASADVARDGCRSWRRALGFHGDQTAEWRAAPACSRTGDCPTCTSGC